MKTSAILYSFIYAACLPALLWAETGGNLSRYEVIINRKPFGEEKASAAVQPPAPPKVATRPFVDDLIMCGITESDMGLRVALVNKKKPTETYFLYVGQTDGGVQLVQADYENEKALLRKDDEEYWIQMGATSLASAAPAVAGRRGIPTPPATRRPPGTVRTPRIPTPTPSPAPAPTASPGVATPNDTPTRPMSYAERLRKRREAQIKAREEREKQRREEIENAKQKTLQEYQMELIRAGKPPLPIPLTKEMDDQLVSEGVLPAVEE